MSEFTDYMLLQTEAESLGALQGQIERSVGAAELPLMILGAAASNKAEAEAAWAALEKPVWVMVGTEADITRLSRAGPALHLTVEEDFQSWAVATYVQRHSLVLAILRQPDMYRQATVQYGATQVYDATTNATDLALLAEHFNVNRRALVKTFVPDGGQAFSALLGAPYQQMADYTIPDDAPGAVVFPFNN